MPKKFLTQSQVIEIGTFLPQVCKKAENGFCQYQEKWDDAEVAAKFHVNASNVANLRKNIVGKLMESPRSNSETLGKIAELERKLQALEGRHGRVEAFIVKKFGFTP